MRLLLAIATLLVTSTLASTVLACQTQASVCTSRTAGSFALIDAGKPAAVIIDATADPALRHAADNFAADLGRVGGTAAPRPVAVSAGAHPVIIGVAGHSPLIDGMIQAGKLDVQDMPGQWEAFRQVVVEQPLPGVARALVIVGADRRGAVFGTYDLSAKIGVSPWYWFADVPVARQENVFITAGWHADAPKVKYRGFFINDEDPAFNTWARQRFGGINAQMYAHVFELLLRLKGNYLWPAMWPPKAFNDDDPQNMVLADAMGVVMGTSHHEPMTRAHDEWHRNTDHGVTGGAWNYESNADNLRRFWRGGIERMMSKGDSHGYESLVTLGMRGDGDEAMAEGTATRLLENIVADQRRIIAEVTGKPAERTPQVWALYKEVQDYYDHGMRVPDDVTLLFADDNWGQIRRLPTTDLERAGGFGVYYHFDYVGAPRNYKWLNTTQIEKTWQQMDLAYARGARALWIVNVGDIKPMEFPLSFFMDQAWNPEAMTADAVARYPEQWARASFGPAHAKAIGELVTRYSQYAARRKPELIHPGSFMISDQHGEVLNGMEFGQMVQEWAALQREMVAIRNRMPAHQHPAYLQLVEHPIAAMSNLYQLYYAVAWNRRLAAANDARANIFADRAEAAFARDQALTDAYHRMLDGKWDGMMAQVHIGYTNWQQPATQVMPAVRRVEDKGAARPVVFASAFEPSMEGVVAIEAPDYSRAVNGSGLRWQAIAHLGRTRGSVLALPQGRAPTTQQDNVRLEYDITIEHAGDMSVQLHLSPTLDTTGRGSQRIGVSVNDGPMQVLVDKLLPSPTATTLEEQRDWNRAVEDNVRVLQAVFPDTPAGTHTLKVWRLDDNVVLSKVVAATRPIPLLYLGPPATR